MAIISVSRFNGIELYLGCFVTFWSGLALTFLYTGDVRWECEVFHGSIHGAGVPIMPPSGKYANGTARDNYFWRAPEYSCLQHTPARYGSNKLAKEGCNRQQALNCRWTTGKVWNCGDQDHNIISAIADLANYQTSEGGRDHGVENIDYVTGVSSGCAVDPRLDSTHSTWDADQLQFGMSVFTEIDEVHVQMRSCCTHYTPTFKDRDHRGNTIMCHDFEGMINGEPAADEGDHVPCRNDQGDEFGDQRDGDADPVPEQMGRCLPHAVGSIGTTVADATFASYNVHDKSNQDDWKLAQLETRKCYSLNDYRLPDEFPNLHEKYQDQAEIVHKLLLGVMLGYWISLFARFSYHIPPYFLTSVSTKKGFDLAFRVLDFFCVTASVVCSIIAIIYMHDILRDSRARTDPAAFDEGGWTEADTDSHFERMRYAEGFYYVVGFGAAAFLQWIWLLQFLPDSLYLNIPGGGFFREIPEDIKDAKGDALFTARVKEAHV